MSSISPSPPDSSSPPLPQPISPLPQPISPPLPQPISPPLTSPSTSPPPSQSNSTSPVATPPASHSLAPAATSPPPAEVPMATPPPTTVSPPPITVSPPPQSSTPPPPAIVPPPASSPPPPSANPPSGSTLAPPPTTSPPPPPPSSSPPPPISPISSPPPSSSPPPPISPISSPPPPSTDPPTSSPPPPSSNPPPASSPPPPPVPPRNAPPPPTSRPPESSPPPPSTQPPKNSPPPPASKPPENSPPPPVSKPPPRSPPPPASDPPSISPPPPVSTPPRNSPPAPVLTPPPGTLSPPPPSPSLVPLGAPPNDNSSSNVSDSSGSTGGGGIGTAGTIAIGLVFGLILLGLVGTAACWCFCKRKKKASGPNGGYILPTSVVSSPKSDSGLLKEEKLAANARSGSINGFVYSPAEPGGLGNSRPLYSYEELMAATDGFSAHNLLGQGGFGSVYKGLLVDGREVAVKQLNIDGRQGEREFRAEVEIISRIHHRHLVSLVGYCISDYRRLLIYDYVPNNTLYFHLHGRGMPALDWTRRVRIAVGAARGLAYLHEDCHPRVIHRDIKSSNILLDNNFEARVSDFGLAKLCQDADTHISTRVIGTFGYLAPEYATSGKLTEKSDVFSFGVVLLELITGRKPVDASKPLGEESVVEWGRPLLSQALDSRQLEELVDSSLEKNYDEREMFLLIEVAAACVRHSSAKRPQMGQVVRAFDSMATSDLTNGMRVGESEIFNSAEQSAEIRLFRRMGFGIQDFSTDFFSHVSHS